MRKHNLKKKLLLPKVKPFFFENKILDTSGSMSGSRIQACKAFLEKFLTLLLENDFADITLIDFK